ncbi:hypothetical protein KAM385_32840 [Aeromonas hydrophila]|nr:hypothetical protein KAM385_32840 [Aeromonas hydrophila]
MNIVIIICIEHRDTLRQKIYGSDDMPDDSSIIYLGQMRIFDPENSVYVIVFFAVLSAINIAELYIWTTWLGSGCPYPVQGRARENIGIKEWKREWYCLLSISKGYQMEIYQPSPIFVNDEIIITYLLILFLCP